VTSLVIAIGKMQCWCRLSIRTLLAARSSELKPMKIDIGERKMDTDLTRLAWRLGPMPEKGIHANHCNTPDDNWATPLQLQAKELLKRKHSTRIIITTKDEAPIFRPRADTITCNKTTNRRIIRTLHIQRKIKMQPNKKSFFRDIALGHFFVPQPKVR